MCAGFQRSAGSSMPTYGKNNTEILDDLFRTRLMPITGSVSIPTLVLSLITLGRKRLVPKLGQTALRWALYV